MGFDIKALRGITPKENITNDTVIQKSPEAVVKVQPMSVTIHRRQLAKTIYKIMSGEADGIFLTKDKTCGIYFEQCGDFLKMGLCMTAIEGDMGSQFMKPSEYAEANKVAKIERKEANKPSEWSGDGKRAGDTVY